MSLGGGFSTTMNNAVAAADSVVSAHFVTVLICMHSVHLTLTEVSFRYARMYILAKFVFHIIECDSTLYVGMTRKQNGGPIPPIHYSFTKYRLWKGIKPKRTLSSLFRLI